MIAVFESPGENGRGPIPMNMRGSYRIGAQSAAIVVHLENHQ
jgi:hypothetical protein